MNIKITFMALVAILTLASNVNAENNQHFTGTITMEDGVSASNYRSAHSFKCGEHIFDVTVISNDSINIQFLKVDGIDVDHEAIGEINEILQRNTWFRGITTSCTSNVQIINLITGRMDVNSNVPLRFERGLLKL